MTDQSVSLDVPFAELNAFQRKMEEINRTAEGFSRTLTGGLKAAIVDGRSLESVFRQIALSASSRLLNSALRPLEALAGQAIGAVLPFAKGGVVQHPALFGIDGGIGMMGEAGAEAILPLSRGTDGRLGVRSAQNETPAQAPVQIHIAARDVESFKRSEAQVAAIVARAVGRGRRGL